MKLKKSKKIDNKYVIGAFVVFFIIVCVVSFIEINRIPKSTKENRFETRATEALKNAQTQFINDMNGEVLSKKIYGSNCEHKLDLYTKDEYLIEVDESGKVVKFYYSDYNKEKSIAYEGDNFTVIDIEDLTKEYDKNIDFTCN